MKQWEIMKLAEEQAEQERSLILNSKIEKLELEVLNDTELNKSKESLNDFKKNVEPQMYLEHLSYLLRNSPSYRGEY